MTILDQCDTLNEFLDGFVDSALADPNLDVKTKCQIIFKMIKNSTKKKAKIRQVLIDNNIITVKDVLHVKSGSLVASQLPASSDKAHFVASVIDDVFKVVRFDVRKAYRTGHSVHGKIHKSDARRCEITEGVLVYKA